MEPWGKDRYGDPCRECGFGWSISPQDAIALVAAIPGRYADLLADRDAGSRHPGLTWSAGEYVCHVTDNLRIWSERLAGAALGGQPRVAGYDTDLLAAARRYDRVAVAGALWSLRHAAAGWAEAVALAGQAGVVLAHDGRGEQRVRDVVRNNAHDACHHARDIERILASPAPAGPGQDREGSLWAGLTSAGSAPSTR
jgi:hypothetical protein